MIENTGNNEFEQSSAEANGPKAGDQSSMGDLGSLPIDKLKDYGKKAYGPLVNVVHRYQDEITPYLTALSRGLQGGVDALSEDSGSETDKYVSGWFREAAEGLNEAVTKLQSKDVNEVIQFIETQAQKRPSLMFTSSYLTGLFFGRISKHIGRKVFQGKSEFEKDINVGSQPMH
jgi:hypothetical protein